MGSRADEISSTIEQLIIYAVRYYELTQKPVGISGEVGEYWASKHLSLELAVARTAGYDAIDPVNGRKVQIKTRLVKNRKKLSGRMGAISLKYDWDTVVLVLMEKAFEPFAMYELTRQKVIMAINKTDSKARRKGALAISEFKKIGTPLWIAEDALL